jgi:hypothetical protein
LVSPSALQSVAKATNITMEMAASFAMPAGALWREEVMAEEVEKEAEVVVSLNEERLHLCGPSAALQL